MAPFIDKILQASDMYQKVSNETIYLYWHGAPLTVLNILCLKSYLYHGHKPVLYLYEHQDGIPDGVEVRNANEIISLSDFGLLDHFRAYRRNCFANQRMVIDNEEELEASCRVLFSNYFRMTLLYKHGGWWSDLDMVCLKPYDFNEPFVFAGQVINDEFSVNPCVVKCPAENFLAQHGISYIRRAFFKNGDTIHCGAYLFSFLVSRFKLMQYAKPQEIFQPIGFLEYEDLLKETPLPESSYGVHLYNFTFAKNHDPDGHYDPDCLLEKLKTKYL